MGEFDDTIKIIKLRGFGGENNISARNLIETIIGRDGEVNPLGNDQYIINGVKVELMALKGKLHIKFIEAIDKGKGMGTEVMKDILDQADEEGVDVTVYPKSVGSTTDEQLRKWYSSLGFEERGEDMIYYSK